MKVKVFRKASTDGLEKMIQIWLDSMDGKNERDEIDVVFVSQSESNFNTTVVILYKIK